MSRLFQELRIFINIMTRNMIYCTARETGIYSFDYFSFFDKSKADLE